VITSVFSYLKVTVISLAIISLLGCKAISGYYPRQESTHSISSTDVFVTIPQDKVVLGQPTGVGRPFLFRRPSLALQWPIVAVILIANVLSGSKAGGKTQRLRDSLVEFDINSVFLESLNVELSAIKWLNVKNFTHNLDTEKKLRENSYANTRADKVLFINVRYSMEKDFSTLNAYAEILLFTKKEVLKQYSENRYSSKTRPYNKFKRKSIFRDEVSRQETLPGTIIGKRQLNETHLNNNGEIEKESLITLAELLKDEIISSIQKSGITLLD
jgi:hypothetical protein